MASKGKEGMYSGARNSCMSPTFRILDRLTDRTQVLLVGGHGFEVGVQAIFDAKQQQTRG